MERNSGLKRLLIGIISFILICVTLLAITPVVSSGENQNPNTTISTEIPTISVEDQVQTYLKDIQFINPQNKEEIVVFNGVINTYIESLYDVLETYDYRTDDYKKAYRILGAEIDRMQALLERYDAIYKEMTAAELAASKRAKQEQEYPEATFIWYYMKEEFGWSDETCAGIMGNMMAEVGGGTLSGLRNWDSCGSSGLGLIQWLGGRRSTIVARYGSVPTIEQQLLYMYDELHGTNGIGQQVGDKTLAIILNVDGTHTPEEIAFTFACYYERCAENHRAIRRPYARTAYEYFVG